MADNPSQSSSGQPPSSTPQQPPFSSNPSGPQPGHHPPSDGNAGNQREIDRVRELILGPEMQMRPRQAEVDRLREILFGAQMEEYDRTFKDLRREMERMLADVRQLQDTVGDFEKNQRRQLENLEREMRQTTDELRREVERLRNQETLLQQVVAQVRQQDKTHQGLIETAQVLRQSLAQHEQELRALSGSNREFRDQSERKADALKRELRQSEDTIRSEVRRITDRLDDQKTDRRALAAMLIEIATRLETGSNVTNLLEDLAPGDDR